MLDENFTSLRAYTYVFLALLILTALTTALGYVELGAFGLVAALAVASFKALLIALFFMHLKESLGIIILSAASGLAWVLILGLHTLLDYLTRTI